MLSEAYAITSGLKQGGVLSPFLFTVFMNDLLLILCKKGLGCHVKTMFLGAIIYVVLSYTLNYRNLYNSDVHYISIIIVIYILVS